MLGNNHQNNGFTLASRGNGQQADQRSLFCGTATTGGAGLGDILQRISSAAQQQNTATQASRNFSVPTPSTPSLFGSMPQTPTHSPTNSATWVEHASVAT